MNPVPISRPSDQLEIQRDSEKSSESYSLSSVSSSGSIDEDEAGSQKKIITEMEEDEFYIPQESKIYKTLSDKTIKTVVMLVLILLFSLMLCSSEQYIESDILHE